MKKVSALTLLLFNWAFLFAQKPVVFSTAEGCLRVYDPVAYFTGSKPTKGKDELTFSYQGAFGMSRCYKADTEPGAWTVVDGKLYVNYNLSVRTEWNKKQCEYIEKASNNWPVTKGK
jgi:hypothetical protein